VEDPRTLQANERTLLAWLRTGLSLITFGFVIAKTALWLNGAHGPTGLSAPIGTTFILVGAGAEVIGLIRFVRVRRALLAGRSAPTGAVEVVAIAVVTAALGLLLGLHGLAPTFGAR